MTAVYIPAHLDEQHPNPNKVWSKQHIGWQVKARSSVADLLFKDMVIRKQTRADLWLTVLANAGHILIEEAEEGLRIRMSVGDGGFCIVPLLDNSWHARSKETSQGLPKMTVGNSAS